jgi:hypothetical protein
MFSPIRFDCFAFRRESTLRYSREDIVADFIVTRWCKWTTKLPHITAWLMAQHFSRPALRQESVNSRDVPNRCHVAIAPLATWRAIYGFTHCLASPLHDLLGESRSV